MDIASSDARRNDRPRIIFELQHKLAFNEEDAQRIVITRSVFDQVSLAEAIERIDALALNLGPEIGKTLLVQQPYCINFTLEHLGDRLEDLKRDGHMTVQAVRVLTLCIDIVDLPGERFYRTHTALCDMLPVRNERHTLIRLQPRIYLIPAERLKQATGLMWKGTPERYWLDLCQQLPEFMPPAEKEGTHRRIGRVPITGARLYERLIGAGVQAPMARSLTIKFSNAFQEKAEEVLEDFFQHGWTSGDIVTLAQDEGISTWRQNPQGFFATEKMLVELGFDAKESRELIINRQGVTTIDPERLKRVVMEFLSFGYAHAEILAFAHTRFRILNVEPNLVGLWHSRIRADGRPAASHLGLLIQGENLQSRPQRPQRPAPQPPAIIAEDMGTLPEPQPDPPPTHPAILAQPAPALEPRTLLAGVINQLERQAEPSPAEPPPTPPASEESSLDDSGDPPPQSDTLLRPQVIPAQTADTDDDGGDGADDWEPNWQVDILKILKDKRPNLTEASWRRFKLRYDWMWDQTGPGPAALSTLVLWCGMVRKSSMHQRSLHGKVVLNPKLHDILKLSPAAIQYRAWVLQRLLDRDFVKKPELLLIPFEQIPEKDLRGRVHEIESRKKQANRKPYLSMLLEPLNSGPITRYGDTRFQHASFLARLERYIAKQKIFDRIY